MKNLKKVLSVSLILISFLFVLAGCDTHSNLEYTYNVSTGDKIKLTLDTKKGYSMTSEVPVKIKKDDNVMAVASFFEDSAYDNTVNSARYLSNVDIIDEGSKDNIDYLFYNYNDQEYTYVIKIKDSKTCVILTSEDSQDDVEECFDRLTFSKE